MANEIRTKTVSTNVLTITLSNLTNGSARQSTLLSNSSNYPAALVTAKMQSGVGAPTAGSIYEVYLLRSDGTTADDNAGASDAAITIENSPLLGTMVLTATANKNFYGIYDTAVLGPLGTTWGIAVKNSSGQTTSLTSGNLIIQASYYVPEIQ